MKVSKIVKRSAIKELVGGVELHQFGQGRCAVRREDFESNTGKLKEAECGRFLKEWRKSRERSGPS